ncbi:MAG: hypothetical protein A2360_03410 [Candidatus Staskawiczbacteria bacterium RIFOXYB1_FULL_32_11]|uniref:DUF5668 domain-containing protein n=1 Tax=Candidatus Staskawiczbacteria bacterium RIFOXYD1_FULL_32_13 TaxID=1802234 RepID=A0A1G2JLL7_9BACT|nr:MAG: hypothetical protein UR22_C0017G0006 [Parcubacteria group bacterium GW2011_GWC2_32_10]OGZ77762.1 MAG: hypothetical protein A2256_01025 [Candidatus Staskawiczbacteria bacterium RIFOXYA2_FULL_32_7]OGZ78411.1 MAG: hypothetical protein A2360_03410 [Candidatus Staskawiczbacteria bacterium RIFOXYB1_FULL_32_11]OGZ86403.1 MAG: hypothetical protein A2463_03015 [Candidatus Staskawiczbacteria bacterium RIFOXYC2_FULL_32_10]OGZ87853.1 MAG: hypothetical protein A2561_04820 [Candidatus Staskawiczbacte
MQNKKTLFVVSLIALLFANLAKAVCPVCVVAVGGGLYFTRKFGLDDMVTSLWIGGILVALVLWTIDWMRKKGWRFKFDDLTIWLAYYVLTLVPLSYYNIIGSINNKFWGVDKILFGTFLGTFIFLGAVWLNGYLKNKNNGKGYFPYQKVVVPFSILALSSLILYFLV